jgi:putative hemolysin
MSTVIAILATVSLMLFANALYVAAEFSSVRSRKTRIGQMADAGNWLAEQLLPILRDPQKLDDYIAACQVGITASSLVLGAYGQNTIARLLTPGLERLGSLAGATAFSISATGTLIFLTILQVVLGELLPKSVAIQHAERLALATVVPLKWSLFLFRPLIWLFNGSGNLVLKLCGLSETDDHTHIHSPSEIELLVTDSHEGGLIDDKERQMLRNAFRMRELTARQVMVPRTRMVSAAVTCSVVEVLAKAIEEGYSRIPIYEETVDNIIGFVHIKDLFRQHLHGEENLREILRQVIYVPETLPIIDVWETLNEQRQYIVIVFDEYGGTEGLITFEDLIEEIFGELQDEFDEEEMALISYDKAGRTHLRADLLIADINEYLSLDLPNDEADTLGGLVFSKLGRPPVVGDEVTINDLAIRVEAIADLGISEISFQLPTTGDFKIGEWEVAPHE